MAETKTIHTDTDTQTHTDTHRERERELTCFIRVLVAVVALDDFSGLEVLEIAIHLIEPVHPVTRTDRQRRMERQRKRETYLSAAGSVLVCRMKRDLSCSAICAAA